jgi:hypothetical protein
MKVRTVPLVFLAALVVAAPAIGDGSAHGKPAKSAAFEHFRQLAGNWEGKMSEDGKTWFPATANYKVTSGGSAVVETLGPGTPHEMVTIIHPDGKELALTHYCAIGNQPHMKAAVNGDANKFDFHFVGGSNMDSDKDSHMHSVTFTFVDKDTLRTDWTHFDNGKKSGEAIFELKRKK